MFKEITQQKFNQLNLKTAEETLQILKTEYNKEYEETIKDLIGFCRDMDEQIGHEPKDYTEKQILEIFSDDNIIEFIENIIGKEIFRHYIVKDTSLTLNDFKLQSGYELIH